MAAGKVLPALRRHSTFSESESAFEWKSKECHMCPLAALLHARPTELICRDVPAEETAQAMCAGDFVGDRDSV
ncbi:hypothetical protein SRHO_G00050460 [Serrasalmus rhombeus]